MNGLKPTPTVPSTSTTLAEARAGKGPTTPVHQQHTVPLQTRGHHAAVQKPMRNPPSTRRSTRSYFRPMPRHRCLRSRLPRAGFTGPGAPRLHTSGVTAQRGRTGTCQPRHIRPHSSAVITSPILVEWDYQSITDDVDMEVLMYYMCSFLMICISALF